MTAITADELSQWRALRGPALTDALLNARWYPQPDDLIGGWCVMPVDAPPSCGVPSVADFLGEVVARHVADLHNQHIGGEPAPDQQRSKEQIT